MPTGLRTKKAQAIVYRILGVPPSLKDEVRKPRKPRPITKNFNPNDLYVDDSQIGERYL